MTTLREVLQSRRTAELPASRSCEIADAPVPALQIHIWSGDKWVLPWACFNAVHHQTTGESEQLTLSFARHEVLVEGTCLAPLLPAIATFRLDCLRNLPANFRTEVEKGEPFITRVSMRALSDFDSSKRGGEPKPISR